MKLKFSTTPSDIDSNQFSDIGLKGVVLNGPAGNLFWNVGNSIISDIYLPKTRSCLASQFII